MTDRKGMLVLFAAVLALAGALIVAGVLMWSLPAGLVTAGVLLAGWATLFLLDVPAPTGADA